MAFPHKDIRLTTRGRGSDGATLHPHLVRDSSILLQIALAISYFESMLGRERREVDADALLHFFGDPKLARCLIACLGRGYRYRPPELGQIVTRAALRRLERLGLAAPKALRLRLYDQVNERDHGFLRSSRRAAAFESLERKLRLRAGELERLLSLDAAEHAVLIRVGDEPRPEDVVAQYNFGVLDTLLRQAERVELSLADRTREAAEALRALCSANQVQARVHVQAGRSRLEIAGRQDALGTWTRQGRRVARTVVQVLERARPAVLEGSATLVLRGRQGCLRLTGELLDILGGAPAPSSGWEVNDGWDLAAVVQPAARRPLGRTGRARADGSSERGWSATRSGWSLRRLPDPQAWSTGVIVPDLLVDLGSQRVFLCAVRSMAQAARLAAVARSARTGEPFVFVGEPATLAPLQAVDAWTIVLPRPAGESLVEALRASLAEPKPTGPVRRRAG